RNEEFCQWCYANGTFAYHDLAELIDFLTGSMANESWPPEQVRAYLEEHLPKLGYWQKIKNESLHLSEFQGEDSRFSAQNMVYYKSIHSFWNTYRRKENAAA